MIQLKHLLTRFIFALALLFVIGSTVHAEPITLVTPTGSLQGTLELPRASAAPHPVALIIAGSGPTDRDGNNPLFPGQNNSLKMLAEGLAAQGIASVRYDKRGIGQSATAAKSEAELRFENLIDDARLWGKHMKRDKRFSSLTIIGHSEGSLIGMVAARQCKADAFVSIAGISRPAGEILLGQLRAQLPPELIKESEAIVRQLNAGKTVASVSPQLETVFRPSVQPYVISWFRYDPVQELSKFRGRVLLVQGTTDIQVGTEEAQRLAKAQPEAKLWILEGMNHVLKNVPSDSAKQVASYSDPSLPLAPSLVDTIVQFITQAS